MNTNKTVKNREYWIKWRWTFKIDIVYLNLFWPKIQLCVNFNKKSPVFLASFMDSHRHNENIYIKTDRHTYRRHFNQFFWLRGTPNECFIFPQQLNIAIVYDHYMLSLYIVYRPIIREQIKSDIVENNPRFSLNSSNCQLTMYHVVSLLTEHNGSRQLDPEVLF